MVTIRGKLQTGEEEEAFELHFEDTEISAMRVYAADVGTLLQSSFLRSPDHFHFSMKFSGLQSATPETKVESGAFDQEQWAAFLHLFRPLSGLNSDRGLYGFPKVRKLIERRAASYPRMTNTLKQMLEKVQSKLLPMAMEFGVNGTTYDLEGIFGLWMNAMEFHRDADKQAILAQIHQFFPADGMRTLMAGLALEKLYAMAGLRNLILHLMAPPGAEAAPTLL